MYKFSPRLIREQLQKCSKQTFQLVSAPTFTDRTKLSRWSRPAKPHWQCASACCPGPASNKARAGPPRVSTRDGAAQAGQCGCVAHCDSSRRARTHTAPGQRATPRHATRMISQIIIMVPPPKPRGQRRRRSRRARMMPLRRAGRGWAAYCDSSRRLRVRACPRPRAVRPPPPTRLPKH